MDRIRTTAIMLLSATLTILTLLAFSSNSQCDPIIGRYSPLGQDVVGMPIVLDTNPTLARANYAPTEDRGEEYRRWLAASVKVTVSGASGSGTICYYDHKTGWAYVISCGHLWSGSRPAEDLVINPVNGGVVVWYRNNEKLAEPRKYDAEVLFWSNQRGYDCSCLRFRPDWIPAYYPIAPLDYGLRSGDILHSCGCDGGREVAHYDVEFVEYRGGDLITNRNSPRPGRSGGGLMTDDFYVAVCWGTSDTVSGDGIGYFTPLSAIHKVYSQNGYDWLLQVSKSGLAQQIPIYNRSSPNHVDGPDFIILPRLPVPIRH